MEHGRPWCNACQNRTDCPLHKLQINVTYPAVSQLLHSNTLAHNGKPIKGNHSSRTFGNGYDQRRYEIEVQQNIARMSCSSVKNGLFGYLGTWIPAFRSQPNTVEVMRDIASEREPYFKLLGDFINLSWAYHLDKSENIELADPNSVRIYSFVREAQKEQEKYRKLYLLGTAYGYALATPYHSSLFEFFQEANLNSLFKGYGNEIVHSIIDNNYLELSKIHLNAKEGEAKLLELLHRGSSVLPRVAGPLSIYNKAFLDSNLSSRQIGKSVRLTATINQASLSLFKQLFGAVYESDFEEVPPEFKCSIKGAPILLQDNKYGLNLDFIRRLNQQSLHCPASYRPTEQCLDIMQTQFKHTCANQQLNRFLSGKVTVLEHMGEMIDENYPYITAVWDENPSFSAFRSELGLPNE